MLGASNGGFGPHFGPQGEVGDQLTLVGGWSCCCGHLSGNRRRSGGKFIAAGQHICCPPCRGFTSDIHPHLEHDFGALKV